MPPPPAKAARGRPQEREELQMFKELYDRYSRKHRIPPLQEVVNLFVQNKKNTEKTQPVTKMRSEAIAVTLQGATSAQAFGILVAALLKSNLQDIRGFRLWHCSEGEQMIPHICFYMENLQAPVLTELQLLQCSLRYSGYQLLGKTLSKPSLNRISYLCLDYNAFGLEGMQLLCPGLRSSPFLRYLSLQYCGLSPSDGKHLFQILIFMDSSLQTLKLLGNSLSNDGVDAVFRGASISTTLIELDIADNKIIETDIMLDSLTALIKTKNNITSYDLRWNQITSKSVPTLLDVIQRQKHLRFLKLPTSVPEKELRSIKAAIKLSKKSAPRTVE